MKIKKIVIMIALCFLYLINDSFSQSLTQGQKQKLIDDLSSGDFLTKRSAILDIQRYNVTEALPVIEEEIWGQDCALMMHFLQTIELFNSPNLYNISLALIDSMDNCNNNLFNFRLQVKVEAVRILYEHGNYSYTGYIFELLRYEDSPLALNLLPKVIQNVPEYEDSAKIYLFNITSDLSLSWWSRAMALTYIVELYPDEATPVLVDKIKNDPSDVNRYTAFEFLCQRNYPELEQLLRERIVQEPVAPYRLYFADSLLYKFETVSNYKFLRDYVIIEPDTINTSLMPWYLDRYVPTKPDSIVTESEMLDSLISYNNQSYEFGWINDTDTYNTISAKLNDIKTDISTQTWDNALTKTNDYLQYVENALTQNDINNDAYKFLKYYCEYIQERLSDLVPSENPLLNIKLIDSHGNLLTGGSLKYYEGGWKDAIDNGDGTFKVETERTAVSLRMTYAYGSQDASNIQAQNNTYTFQTANTTVELRNSEGNLLTEEAVVKYYSGGWRDFGTTVNGVATKELLPNNYSFRITYAFASNDKQQNLNDNTAIIFQTVNTSVQLQDSQGNPIEEAATVKYYSGGWRDFGTTVNGIATKELLPNNYSFRMTYAFASNDKQQNLNDNTAIIFQTVNTSVQLQDSHGNPITDEATVKYYSGGWRDFGTTDNGTVTKELLPNNYSFRMTYAYASNDKQQNLSENSTVVFQTVNTNVQLQDSQGNPIAEEAAVKYYSGGWRDFGTTVNGTAIKELLPNNYSFRMTYAFASNDKQQNLNDNTAVIFQTVNAQVQLKDSQGNPITEEAAVKYYSGGWRDFGTTVNGIATKELLPNNYSFRITYAFASNDKQQNLNENTTVVFQTVNAQVQLQDSQGNPTAEEAVVKYYSSGWRDFGTTVNGTTVKEVLPNNYSFRMTYTFISNDKQQNVGDNSEVIFSTVLCTVSVKDSQSQPVDNADVKYYSGGWRDFGLTANGNVAKELLPANLNFRLTYNGAQQSLTQDISSNNAVEFIVNEN